MNIYPIWKTIEMDLTAYLTDGVLDYSLSRGSATIYEGRAYADASGNCRIVLNDILRGYLGTTDAPDHTELLWDDIGAFVTFTLTADDYTETFAVLNDWSYRRGVVYSDASPIGLSSPIFTRIPRYSRVPIAAANATSYRISLDGIIIDSGTISSPSVTLWVYADEVGAYRVEFSKTGSTTKRVYEFTSVEACTPAAFVYRNSLGGYDLLPVASFVQTDTYTREGYDAGGDNENEARHISRDYRAGQKKAYTLRTPTLTDEQAAQMHNAIGSLAAWLYTPEGGFEAVNINTAACKRKTYRNEGGKRVTYEIEVQFAQPMERR